jgi:hypothetical protein
MIISWVFLVPIAIVIARYYKALFPDILLCGIQFWFFVHFPVMIFALVLAFIALLVIISDLNWMWVEPIERLDFAHSFFGIMAICLGFLQVNCDTFHNYCLKMSSLSRLKITIALFRCDKNHPYRFVFNYAHQSLGLTTYGFACKLLYSRRLVLFN